VESGAYTDLRAVASFDATPGRTGRIDATPPGVAAARTSTGVAGTPRLTTEQLRGVRQLLLARRRGTAAGRTTTGNDTRHATAVPRLPRPTDGAR